MSHSVHTGPKKTRSGAVLLPTHALPKSKAKTATERQKMLRARRKEAGLVRVEVYVLPEHREAVQSFAAGLILSH